MDEGLLTVNNFTNPTVAEEEYYPEGSYAYSQNVPMALNFGRPLILQSVYLKQHRPPNFYLKNSVGLYNVKGYLDNELVLNATV